mgnify:CR=1 FL=1
MDLNAGSLKNDKLIITLKMNSMINELLAIPTDTGIGEVIHIAVLDGRIDDVIIFIKDQVKLGHRAAIEKAVGVDLVGKIISGS